MGRQRAARLLSRWEEQQNRRLENKRKRKGQADSTDSVTLPNGQVTGISLEVDREGSILTGISMVARRMGEVAESLNTAFGNMAQSPGFREMAEIVTGFRPGVISNATPENNPYEHSFERQLRSGFEGYMSQPPQQPQPQDFRTVGDPMMSIDSAFISSFDNSYFQSLQRSMQQRVVNALMVPANVLNGPPRDPRLPHYCESCCKLEAPGGEPLTMRYLETLYPRQVKEFFEEIIRTRKFSDFNYTDQLLLEKIWLYYLGDYFEEYRENQEVRCWFLETAARPQPLPDQVTYRHVYNLTFEPDGILKPKPQPPADLEAMRAKVARAQKLLQDSSAFLSRVVAGLEVTPEEAQALKARVDAGVEAFTQ